MDSTSTRFVRAAGVLGFVGVMAGTFGAHGLPDEMDPEYLAIFETGVRYHLFHALALLACARVFQAGWPARLAYWGFVLGVILFSGALYLLALTEIKSLGMIAPLGGLLLLAGWLAMVFEANRTSSEFASGNEGQ